MTADLIPIILRGGTSAAAAANNRVLLDNEPGFETDTRKLKVGAGGAAWNDLGYLAGVQPAFVLEHQATGSGFAGKGRNFGTIVVPASPIYNTIGSYDPLYGTLTVEHAGLYLLLGWLRLLDSTPAGVSYSVGAGVGTAGGLVRWATTIANGADGSGGGRHNADITRADLLAAGAVVSLYGYVDTGNGATIDGASLTVIRIA